MHLSTRFFYIGHHSFNVRVRRLILKNAITSMLASLHIHHIRLHVRWSAMFYFFPRVSPRGVLYIQNRSASLCTDTNYPPQRATTSQNTSIRASTAWLLSSDDTRCDRLLSITTRTLQVSLGTCTNSGVEWRGFDGSIELLERIHEDLQWLSII